MAFTPVHAVAGGLAIGLTAHWNARLNGKVTGISGIIANAMRRDLSALSFACGLFLAGALYPRFVPGPLERDLLASASFARVALAGALVGAGTRLGNGCTSGHGVCGLSRFSTRSLCATLTFMGVGAVAAKLSGAALLFEPAALAPLSQLSLQSVLQPRAQVQWALGALAMALALPPAVARLMQATGLSGELLQLAFGVSFGSGLIISGMASPAKVLNFLDFATPHWDPTLLFVFVGALPPAMVGFRSVIRSGTPLLAEKLSLPTRADIDASLVAGAAMFGVGWGILGICPGPAVVYFGAFRTSAKIHVFLASLLAGMTVLEWLRKLVSEKSTVPSASKSEGALRRR